MGKFVQKKPLYTLPHGIEVIGEYAPRGKNPYWRVRVRPHPFFSSKVVAGGIYLRRSRAVMSSVLGRALLPNEHVHHKNENRSDDSPENLELISPADHNSHHKTGATHTEETKAKISNGLKKAYEAGLHSRPTIKNRDSKGRISA